VAGDAFLISGWAIDQGAPAGTGVDLIDVWAYPVGVSTATYLGGGTYGIARPDVASYAGAQQFTNSGFTLIAAIATPGTYDLWVYAHSTVSGVWNNVMIVRVTVAAPASNPRMWVDVPSLNQTTSQNVTIGGWAIDLGSAMGTGVDTVHVWAYPASGATPVFLGAAQYGFSRPDIATYAGASRFAPSGFNLTGTLPPGDYTLAVFAHSTVIGLFNNVMQVPIKVR
jgi:hypothetical protein